MLTDWVLIFIWYAYFLHERQITNDEVKFLLALECNHFHKYMMANVVNMFNNNIICRYLILTKSDFHKNKFSITLNLFYNINHLIFLNNKMFTNFSLLSLSSLKKCWILWQTWNFCEFPCFYFSLCTSHWCRNQLKEVRVFRQKLYFKETYSWWDNSITWSYAAGVMCILTRKYEGTFCCSLYGVKSLLNFIFKVLSAALCIMLKVC